MKTDIEVAKILGFNRSTLAERKTRNSIPFEEIAIFSNHENISINWLLTGKGEMFTKAAGTGSQELIDKTVNIMKKMDKKSQEDVLRYAEKERLLSKLMKEK